MNEEFFDFIIVGGGIAGTTCAQRLCSLIEYDESEKNDVKVLLLSSSQMVKTMANVKQITKFLHEFDVEEKSAHNLTSKHASLKIYKKTVVDLDSDNKIIACHDGCKYKYAKLAICTGGKPKLISSDSEHVLGIRDTETVQQFLEKLSKARQIVIVGNGGIATELVYEIENCKIIWAIKDSHISHIYFDAHVSKFFETIINENKLDDNEKLPTKRTKYTISSIDMADTSSTSSSSSSSSKALGPGLGPDWSLNLPSKGAHHKKRDIVIEYKCEVKRILNDYDDGGDDKNKWPIYVELTNGKFYGCDFLVSATGVIPATDLFTKNNKFDLADDKGFRVNDKLETNIRDVYAAGDNCTASWQLAPHWFQMKLWNQASQMGDYLARSMWSSFNDRNDLQLDFCFEMFAHITKFFNFKVILLGNYDAKGLGNDYQLLLRCTPGVEYVKVVLRNGRVQGVLLIGETDLEETFENLILNQIDVSSLGEDLINPDIDIEDYFD